MSSALLWLRRDLRLRDHPALVAAAQADRLTPVFCIDERLLNGRHASGPRTQFMLECLAELDGQLRERGSRLFVVAGDPATELRALAERVGADRAAPDRRRRAVRAPSPARGHTTRSASRGSSCACIRACSASTRCATIRTGAGDRTRCSRRFIATGCGSHAARSLRMPRTLPPPGARSRLRPLPSLRDARARAGGAGADAAAASAHARRALQRFLDGRVDRLRRWTRRARGRRRSRGCRPYLHFGCISPREVEHRLGGERRRASAFRRQLCWRDFYAHVLGHFPRQRPRRVPAALPRHAALRRRSRRCSTPGARAEPAIRWSTPAMRQLRREGWMHNRARLVVGSFLTKDLGIDWRWGERWFMRLLLDGDEASNNGNWQWIASVGVDPQPPSRRMLQPALASSSGSTPTAPTSAATCRSCATFPTSTCASRGRCPPRCSARSAAGSAHDYPRADRRSRPGAPRGA